jgi:hypothetical protein
MIDSVGAYTYPNSPDMDVRAISVTFTPDQTTAVLAWGGHISSPLDWGDGTTASDITGSPYHVSNVSLKKMGNVVSSGGQDVQLSAAAVFVPSSINVTKTANKDGAFTFESYLKGFALAPDGESNPWTLDRDQTKTLTAMDDGKITISEIGLPTGDWRVKSITCAKAGTGVVFSYQYASDQETSSAEFDAEEGETFDCTFENEFFGAPVPHVIKKVIGAEQTCTDAIRDGTDNESRGIRTGESVKYCYWVTNTGSDSLLDVSLFDDSGTPGNAVDDQVISLTGGSDIDGDADAPDLGVGEYVSGSLVVVHSIAMNTTVTNVAETMGYGATDGLPYTDTDTANVIVNQASACTLSATVSKNGASACDGSPTVYALEGDRIYWCGDSTWDAGAMMDMTNVWMTLVEDNSVIEEIGSMSPGDSITVEVGSMQAGANDFTGTLAMSGWEGDINPILCTGPATIDVVSPGLQLTKTVMPAGEPCGDLSTITTIINDPVEYCLKVENTGDVTITDVLVDDPIIGIDDYPVGDLAPGQMQTIKFGPFTPSATVTNTASATAMEPLTKTPMGPEMSSATVTVLAADLQVNKSADPSTIVVCEPGDDRPICTMPYAEDTYEATYHIQITNSGPSTATGVTVDDTLPQGFEYLWDDGGCSINQLELSCHIGDIDPGATVSIYVGGYIHIEQSGLEFPWGSLTNRACANTEPLRLDPNSSNNCDTATTNLTTGPTRTIGYWGTHPESLAYCTDLGSINLGYLTMYSENSDGEVDATVSTDTSKRGRYNTSMMAATVLDDADGQMTPLLEMAKGMLNANVTKWSDGTPRSLIGHARTKTSRQLTAAWCNEMLFGSSFASYLGGWDRVRRIMAGEGYLDNGSFVDCAGTCSDNHLRSVIESIEWINGVSDAYNKGGDALSIPIPRTPAQPHAPEDDPTDPGN